MTRRGNTIRTEQGFSIVEEIADYQDRTPSSVVGYIIWGPQGKASMILSEEQAHLKIEELLHQLSA